MDLCELQYHFLIVGFSAGIFIWFPLTLFFKFKLNPILDPHAKDRFDKNEVYLPFYGFRRGMVYAGIIALKKVKQRHFPNYDLTSELQPWIVWLCRFYFWMMVAAAICIFVPIGLFRC